MARLLVFRGDFVEREIELGGTPIRIGRAPECDVVLEDPDRGISRAHAEVRYEDGAYLIVDLGSQNGIFQYGARVDRAYLEPESPINLGPFRLVIDETDAAPSSGPSRLHEPAARGSARRVTDAADYDDADDDHRLDESGVRPRRRGEPAWWRTHAKTLWLGGAAVVVAGGLGLAGLLSSQGPSDEERIIAHLSAARTLLEQLEPQRAITEHIDPALAIDNTNLDANDLKVRAQELADRLAAGSQPASEAASVPSTAGTREASGRIASAGSAAGSDAAVPSAAAPRRADAVPERTPETQFRAQIEEARQLRDKGQFLAAERVLELVIRDAGPGFGDAKAMLDGIRQRRIQEGQRLFREATDEAANERWDDAIAKFTRAHEVDPTLVVASQIEDVQRRKLDLANAKYKEAEVARKFGSNAEALRLYEQVIRLLPANHPLYADVEKKIKELRK